MRVCVIGAGASGLASIKHLKDYGIEDVVCFEKGRYIGGLWKYKAENREGFGSVMRNTILNTSKEFVAFSDFPIDAEVANFPRNEVIYKYFQDYCEKFDLKKHICFQSNVVSIDYADDYSETGDWNVTVLGPSSRFVEKFSHVIVANGHHWKPFTPDLPGLSDFKGTSLHSHDFTTGQRYAERKVLVVGFGNSGGDVACELARISKQVLVSSRHGTWVTRRVIDRGYPRDVVLRTRHFERMNRFLPGFIRRQLAIDEYTTFFDHENYGLRPTELPGQSPVLLADDLPLHLSSGAITIHAGIHHFYENGVTFEDGSKQDIDVVIFCTGYNFDFDFIANGELIPCSDNQVNLWMRIFPPNDDHHTLAVVGLVDPLGSTITMAELQARAVAHIFAKKLRLPPAEQMTRDIAAEKAATAARYRCSARKTSLQIDYIPYMDQLAKVIGCSPPLHLSYFLKEPKVAFLLHFGPVYAAHYRLQGPHSAPTAISHIQNTFQRVHQGMSRNINKRTPIVLLLFNRPTIAFLKLLTIGIFLMFTFYFVFLC